MINKKGDCIVYNKTKMRVLIATGIVFLIGFIGMIGYTLGNQLTTNQATKEAEKNASVILEQKAQEVADKTLTDEKVQDFLIQYYTKTKLGENNHRIKNFMTESAYNEELTKQGLAVNQVNKDFIVDYVFEEATVFINSKTNEVISDVTYSVTYLSELSNAQQFKNTQQETATVKLVYTEVSGKLLVNQIIPWKIALSDMADGGNNLINQTNSGENSSSPKPSNEIQLTPSNPA